MANILKTILTTINDNYLLKIIIMYITCIVLHFVAAHLYVKYCVYPSIIGLLLSPFITSTPYCHAFRWTIYNCGATINLMWILGANWIIN